MLTVYPAPRLSTFIRAVKFRHSDNRLNVDFNSGLSLDYINVPEIVARMFSNADSWGKIYNSFIKGKFESIPHIEDASWNLELSLPMEEIINPPKT